ncbi:MAG: N-6 DNA methylase [Sulfurimonas sp.]|nr:N-6 DNA methylase [Sulfurimonas sp.]
MFFGTGIPTVILVLKQQRDNTDILIVDASKGFEKVGKNNKLKASDIKKIADTVIKRETLAKYSKVVSRETIRENGYNLNIPRYVDSSPEDESFDIYATMFGGIPKYEIDKLKVYWQAFPTLKTALFDDISSEYTDIKSDNIKQTITQHSDVKTFIDTV